RVDPDALEPIRRERHARIAGAIVPRPSRVGDSLVHGASQTRVPAERMSRLADGVQGPGEADLGELGTDPSRRRIDAAPTPSRCGANPNRHCLQRRNAEAGPRPFPTSKTRGRNSKSVGTKSKPVGTKSKSGGTKSKSGGTKSKSHFLPRI